MIFIIDKDRGTSHEEEALQQVIDITKYYKVTMSTKETSIGLIVFLVNGFLFLLMACSTIFIYNKNHASFFKFLPKSLWFTIIAGCLLLLVTVILEYGDITSMKCNFKVFLISLCITLTSVPPLYQLIVNFPEVNKFSKWVEKHTFITMSCFIMVDVFILILSFISPFEVESKYISGGQNFNVCSITKSTFNILILGIIVLYKVVIAVSILILCFLEWNIAETLYDIRFLMVTLYINIIGNIGYIIINNTNISNYKLYFIIREIFYLFYSINNYILLYGYRIAFALFKKPDTGKKEDTERDILRKSKITASAVSRSVVSRGSANDLNSNNKENSKASSTNRLSKKILKYHYQTSRSQTTSVSNEVMPTSSVVKSVGSVHMNQA